MGLRLFFLSNFPGAMFIQGATFIPDSRVINYAVGFKAGCYGVFYKLHLQAVGSPKMLIFRQRL